jgi:hypothetical protein
MARVGTGFIRFSELRSVLGLSSGTPFRLSRMYDFATDTPSQGRLALGALRGRAKRTLRTACWTAIDGTGADVSYSVHVDGETGQSCVTGNYFSTAAVPIYDLSPSSTAGTVRFSLPAASPTGAAFAIIFDNTGTALRWAALDGTIVGSDVGFGVVIDPRNQDVYVAGYYGGASVVNVCDFSATSTAGVSRFTLPAASTGAGFLVRWSGSTGTATSWTTFDGTGSDDVYAVALDPTRSVVYIAGSYVSTGTVPVRDLSQSSVAGTLRGTLPVSAQRSGFVARFSTQTGEALGWNHLDGTSTDTAFALAVSPSDGTAYLAGMYMSTSAVPVRDLSTATSAGSLRFSLPVSTGGAFLVKYSAAGVAQAWHVFDGTSVLDSAYSIAVDSFGNAYVAGSYQGDAVVPVADMSTASSAGTSRLSMPITASSAVYVLRFDAQGTATGCLALDGAGSGTEIGYSVHTDIGRNVYLTGTLNSTSAIVVPDFSTASGPGAPRFSLPATTQGATVLIKWNTDGSASSWTTIDGTASDSGRAVSADSSGNVTLCGSYSSSAPVTVRNLSTSSSAGPALFTIPATSGGASAGFITVMATDGSAPVVATRPAPVTGLGTGSAAVDMASVFNNEAGLRFEIVSAPFPNVAIGANGAMTIAGGRRNATYQVTVRAVNSTGRARDVTLTVTETAPTLRDMACGVIDGTGTDSSFAVATDSFGNTYVSGTYTSTGPVPVFDLAAAQGPTPRFLLPASATGATFLIKYDPAGVAVGWAALDGTGAADSKRALAFDSVGNVFVAGSYSSSGTVAVCDMSSSSTAGTQRFSLPVATPGAAFLVRFTGSTGAAHSWTVVNGSAGASANALVIDGRGVLHLAGTYSSAAATTVADMSTGGAAGTTRFSLPATTGASAFLVRLAVDTGTALSWTRVDGTGADAGLALAVSGTGALFFAGSYVSNSTIDVRDFSTTSTQGLSRFQLPAANTSGTAFVIRFDPFGQASAWTIIDGTGADSLNGLAVDPSGALFCAGSYVSMAAVSVRDFSTSSLAGTQRFTLPAAATTGAAFLIRFAASGAASGWTVIDGPVSADSINALTVEPSTGAVFLTGSYESTCTLRDLSTLNTAGTARFNLPVTLSTAVFVARFAPGTGQCTSWTAVDGTGADAGRAISIDAAGTLTVVGSYTSASGAPVSDMTATSSLDNRPARITLPPVTGQGAFVLQVPTAGPAPTVANPISPATLSQSQTTATRDLTNTFADASGPLVLSLASSPHQSAGISGTTLTVAGAERGTSYDVVVRATNRFGRSADAIMRVTESPPTAALPAAAVTDGSSALDAGSSICRDRLGRTFVAGTYSSGTPVPVFDLSSSSTTTARFSLPAAATAAVYVIVYDAAGTPTSWTVLDGTGADAVRCVHADSADSLYVTGSYVSSGVTLPVRDMSSNSTAGVERFALPASTTGAAFLLKFSASTGQAQSWTTLDGTGSNDAGRSVITDGSGNVCWAGEYTSSAAVPCRDLSSDGTAGAERFLLPAATTGAAFVVALTALGAARSWTTFDGTGADSAQAMAIDASGSLYVGGSYLSSGSVPVRDFSTSSTAGLSRFGLPVANTAGSAAIVKFASNGRALSWTCVEGKGSDSITSLAVDPVTQGLVAAGWYASDAIAPLRHFSESSSLGPSPFNMPATSGTTQAAFLVRYNADGTAASWTAIDGGGADSATTMAVDPATGAIYAAGFYAGSAGVSDLSTSSTPGAQRFTLPASANGSSAAYLVKFTPSGQALAWTALDGPGADSFNNIFVDSMGNVWTTGSYAGAQAVAIRDVATTSVEGSTRISLPAPASGGQAAFLLRLPTAGPQPTVVPPGLGAVTLSTRTSTATVSLASAFADTSGQPLVYSVTTSPFGNSTISGSTLSVQGALRGTTYTIVITAINVYGNRASASLSVTEAAGSLLAAAGTVIEGTSTGAANGVATDRLGNTYVVGSYTSTTPVPVSDIASATVRFSLPGTASSSAGFLIRYDSAGLATGWTTLDGSGADTFNCVAVDDADDSLYVAGRYTSTASVPIRDLSASGTAGAQRFVLPASSTGAGCLIKLSMSTGQPLSWAAIDSTGSDSINALCVDSSAGSLYITGAYAGTVPIADLSTSSTAGVVRFSLPAPTFGTAFLVKYVVATGRAQAWSIIDGNGNDSGMSMCVDGSGGVFLAGQMDSYVTATVRDLSATGTAGAARFTLPQPIGFTSSFAVRYGADNRAISWTVLDGITLNDIPRSIIRNATGDVYMTGQYQSGTVRDFSGSSTAGTVRFSLPVTQSGSGGCFVVRFAAGDLTAHSWTVIDGAGHYVGYALAADATSVYLTGSCSIGSAQQVAVRDMSTTSTAGAQRFLLPATSAEALFMVRFDGLTAHSWTVIDGAGGNDRGLALAVDGTGNVFLAGVVNGGSLTVPLRAMSSMQSVPGRMLSLLPASSKESAFVARLPARVTPPTVVIPLGSATGVSTGTVTRDLTAAFLGTGPLTYEVIECNVPSAEVSGSTLSVHGAERGLTYNVVVRATNELGASASSTLSITETAPAPRDAAVGALIAGTSAEGLVVATDRTGNTYVCGTYTSSVPVPVSDLGSSTTSGAARFSLPVVATSSAAFVVKYAPDGTALSWSTIDGAASATTASVSPRDGTLVVCGSYAGASPVGVFSLSGSSTAGAQRFQLPAASTGAAFVVSFESNGTASRWTTLDCPTAASPDTVTASCVDANGNLYITGSHGLGGSLTTMYGGAAATPVRDLSTSSTAGSTRFSLPATTDGAAAFLVRLSLVSGEAHSWTTVDTPGTGHPDVGAGLCVDGAGSVYWSATRSGKNASLAAVRDMTTSQTFGTARFSLPSLGIASTGTFIVKLDSSGLMLAWTQIGYTADAYTFRVIGRGLCVDATGNVYLSASVTSSTNGSAAVNDMTAVPGTPGTARFNIASTASGAAVIIRFGSLGSPVSCTSVDGGSAVTAGGLAIDSFGNVYLTGSYAGSGSGSGSVTVRDFTTSVSGTVRFTLPLATGQGSYVVKYNGAGVPESWTAFNGSGVRDRTSGLAVDAAGNLLLTGSYSAPAPVPVMDMTASSTAGPARFLLPAAPSGGAHVIRLPASSTVPSPTATTLGTLTLAAGEAGSRSLSSFFTDASGQNLVYSLIASPYGSAVVNLDPLALSVRGAARGLTHTVTVRGTNRYGRFAETSLSVVEAAAALRPFAAGAVTTNGLINHCCLDADGALYAAGSYSDIEPLLLRDLDTGAPRFTIPAPAAGQAALVVKHSASGQLLGWTAVDAPGAVASNVCTDLNGNLYVALLVAATAQAVPVRDLSATGTAGAVRFTLPASPSSTTAFVLRFDSSGAATSWSVVPGSGDVRLAFAAGVLYAAGSHASPSPVPVSDFAPAGSSTSGVSRFSLPAVAQGSSVYLLRFETASVSGLQASSWAAISNGLTTPPVALLADGLGGVLLAGAYTAATAVPVGDLSVSSSTSTQRFQMPAAPSSAAAFVVRYRQDGRAMVWSTIDGTGADAVLSLSLEQSTGAFYLAGSYASSAAVAVNDMSPTGTAGTTRFTLPAAPTGSGFVVRFGATGVPASWAPFSGASLAASCTDSLGNLYVSGSYSGSSLVARSFTTTNTAGTAVFTLPQGLSSTAFALKYSSAGAAQAWTLLDGTGADAVRGVAADSAGALFLAGSYASSIAVPVYDASTTASLGLSRLSLPAAPSSGGFLARIPTTTSPTPTASAITAMSLAAGSATRTLTSFFTNTSGSPLIYTVVTSPFGNATIAGDVLTIAGASRGATYTVGVRGTNIYGRAVDTTLAVTESAPAVKEMAYGVIVNAGAAGASSRSVFTDVLGNVYAAMAYASTDPVPLNDLTYFSSAGTSRATLPALAQDAVETLLLRYDANGQLVGWASLAGVSACSITGDAAGNIYAVCTYASATECLLRDLSTSSSAGTQRFTLPVVTTGSLIAKWGPTGTALSFSILPSVDLVALSVKNDALFVTGAYTSVSSTPVPDMSASNTAGASRFSLPASPAASQVLLRFSASTGSCTSWSLIGSRSGAGGMSVAADNAGGAYLAGVYASASAVPVQDMSPVSVAGPSPFSLPAAAGGAAFVLRFAANGTARGWSSVGAGFQFSIRSLAVDAAGQLYASGAYTSASVVPVNDLSPTSAAGATRFSLPAATTGAAVVLRFTSADVASAWSSLDGVASDSAISVASDAAGNVCVTGSFTASSAGTPVRDFSSSGTAGTTRFTLPEVSNTGVFVARFSSAGTPLSWTILDGTGADAGLSVSSDGVGNVYFAGTVVSAQPIIAYDMSSTSTVGLGRLALPASAVGSAFVMQVPTGGAAPTVALVPTTVSATANPTSTDLSSAFNSVVGGAMLAQMIGALPNGPHANVLLSGSTMAVYGSLRGTEYTVPVRGANRFGKFVDSSVTISEPPPASRVLSAGVFTTGLTSRTRLCNDFQDNLYTAGSYSSATPVPVTDMGSATSSSAVRFDLPPSPSPAQSAFIVEYTTSGTAVAWTVLGSADGAFEIDQVKSDRDGNVYLAGSYTSSTSVPVNDLASTGTAGSTRFHLPSAAERRTFVVEFAANGQALAHFGVHKGSLAGASRCALATDVNLNVYLAGLYSSSSAAVPVCDFSASSTAGTQRFELPSTGASLGAFVLRMASTGVAAAAAALAGLSGDHMGDFSLQVTNRGSLLLAGSYAAGAAVAVRDVSGAGSTAGAVRFSLPAAASTGRAFVVEYSSAGRALSWAALECTSTVANVCTDYLGNTVIAGTYSSGTATAVRDLSATSTAGTLRFSLPLTAATESFVARWSSTGVATSWTALPSARARDLFVDYSASMYLTGTYNSASPVPTRSFSTTSTAGTTSFSLPATISETTFLLRYTAAGTPLCWGRLDGSSVNSSMSITANGEGATFLVSHHTSTDPLPLRDLSTTSSAGTTRLTLPAPSTPSLLTACLPLPPLYEFTTHTFTNAGSTGSFGPNLTAVRSSYAASAPWSSTYLNMDASRIGIQLWTVPATGTYTIVAAGARGGGNNGNFGSGRIVQGTFKLLALEVIKILVGQQGGFNASRGYFAGGGGTFVTTLNNIPLLVGGGGGGRNTGHGQARRGSGDAPEGGNGLVVANNHAAGGGFYGNGATQGTLNLPISSFMDGGNGGNTWVDYSVGGFGGGGGTYKAGGVVVGSGGGYTGGDDNKAQGGGSFLASIRSATATAYGGLNGEHGYVTITKVSDA